MLRQVDLETVGSLLVSMFCFESSLTGCVDVERKDTCTGENDELHQGTRHSRGIALAAISGRIGGEGPISRTQARRRHVFHGGRSERR